MFELLEHLAARYRQDDLKLKNSLPSHLVDHFIEGTNKEGDDAIDEMRAVERLRGRTLLSQEVLEYLLEARAAYRNPSGKKGKKNKLFLEDKS